MQPKPIESLDDAADFLANSGNVAAVEFLRTAAEILDIHRAYVAMKDQPVGDSDDLLAQITPETMRGIDIRRGHFRAVTGTKTKGSGRGMVKFIWKHGENSDESENFQVTVDDIADFPRIYRSYAPSDQDEVSRGWRVEREHPKYGKRTIVYADVVRNGQSELVTVYVQDPNRAGADKPLSKEITSSAQISEQALQAHASDTTRRLSHDQVSQAELDDPTIAQNPTDSSVPKGQIKKPFSAAQSVRAAIAKFKKLHDVEFSPDDLKLIIRTIANPTMRQKGLNGYTDLTRLDLLQRPSIEYDSRNFFKTGMLEVFSKYSILKPKDAHSWKFKVTNMGVDFFYIVGGMLMSDIAKYQDDQFDSLHMDSAEDLEDPVAAFKALVVRFEAVQKRKNAAFLMGAPVDDGKLVTTTADFVAFVKDVQQGNPAPRQVVMNISSKAKDEAILTNTGLAVRSAKELVVPDAVVHVTKRHPNIDGNDWAYLKTVAESFDAVVESEKRGEHGLPRLVFIKKASEAQVYTYVSDFASGRRGHKLIVVTYFKDSPETLLKNLMKNGVSEKSASAAVVVLSFTPKEVLSQTLAQTSNEGEGAQDRANAENEATPIAPESQDDQMLSANAQKRNARLRYFEENSVYNSERSYNYLPFEDFTNMIDALEQIAKDAKSFDEAKAEIQAIKNLPILVTGWFQEKYSNNFKRKPEEAMKVFYEDMQAQKVANAPQTDTRIDPNYNPEDLPTVEDAPVDSVRIILDFSATKSDDRYEDHLATKEARKKVKAWLEANVSAKQMQPKNNAQEGVGYLNDDEDNRVYQANDGALVVFNEEELVLHTIKPSSPNFTLEYRHRLTVPISTKAVKAQSQQQPVDDFATNLARQRQNRANALGLGEMSKEVTGSIADAQQGAIRLQKAYADELAYLNRTTKGFPVGWWGDSIVIGIEGMTGQDFEELSGLPSDEVDDLYNELMISEDTGSLEGELCSDNLKSVSRFVYYSSESQASDAMHIILQLFGLKHTTANYVANGTLFDSALDGGMDSAEDPLGSL